MPLCILDEEATRGETAVYVDLIRDYHPDVVVDSFGASYLPRRTRSCRPARNRASGQYSSSERWISLVEERTAPLDYPVRPQLINKVAAEYGVATSGALR